MSTISSKGATLRKGIDSYLFKDLLEVSENLGADIHKFGGTKILILGGTGFIGSWLTRSLLFMNREYNLNLEVIVTTRNMKVALQKFEFWANDALRFLQLDLAGVQSIPIADIEYVIHGATSSTLVTGSKDTKQVFDSTVTGAESLIKSISLGESIPNVVHLSSGAVYGNKNFKLFREESLRYPNELVLSEYAKAKVEAEKLFNEATSRNLIRGANPRLFAFYGPGMVMNEHFAVGNFLSDALNKREINVSGSPLTTRSYLYPTDLVTWILSILLNPVNQAIHIGSENGISMFDLAKTINKLSNNHGIIITNPNLEPSHYVPSTSITRQLYRLKEIVTLEEGLVRWIKYLEKAS
jgi:nucleoside-diphosphate-sugar epimerase